MYTQKEPYGCGLYAIANAIDFPEIITEERLEESKQGIHLGAMNLYMFEDNTGYFIDVLYCNTFASKLPFEWETVRISGDCEYMPLLIQIIVGEKFHLVGAKLYQNGKISIFDSLRLSPFETTLDNLQPYYSTVVGLYSFNIFETGEYLFL